MRNRTFTRRGLLASIVVIAGGAFFWKKNAAAGLTPSATEGPFYPTAEMRMADVDNDLVKVDGLVKQAGGEIITLKGRVTDREGNPHVGHRIEIWQCDQNGKYLHPGDEREVPYDQVFQGFGHDITGDDGSYSFRTIKPGKYPGRTPHIHVKVLKEGAELLTTQFYVAGDPDNADDGLFNWMSKLQAQKVSMVYITSDTGIETTINLQI